MRLDHIKDEDESKNSIRFVRHFGVKRILIYIIRPRPSKFSARLLSRAPENLSMYQ